MNVIPSIILGFPIIMFSVQKGVIQQTRPLFIEGSQSSAPPLRFVTLFGIPQVWIVTPLPSASANVGTFIEWPSSRLDNGCAINRLIDALDWLFLRIIYISSPINRSIDRKNYDSKSSNNRLIDKTMIQNCRLIVWLTINLHLIAD